MKIALVGYGKMGKIIHSIAEKRGHNVVSCLNETPHKDNLNNPDVVIEFSQPNVAFQNIKNCLELNIPVVCGTTGWLSRRQEVEEICLANNTAFLYGSNFSLGVNLFFALNERLAQMMSRFNEYSIQLEEIHHIHKKDAPSGTAISLADAIIKNNPKFNSWKLEETQDSELGIFAIREDEVPGTHSVFYRSNVDEIEIKHTAYSRDGFALGAVVASEWIYQKKGVYSMKDVLSI